jgi:hypothetical protein
MEFLCGCLLLGPDTLTPSHEVLSLSLDGDMTRRVRSTIYIYFKYCGVTFRELIETP